MRSPEETAARGAEQDTGRGHTPAPVVSVRGVTRRFEVEGATTVALDDVSLDIAPGEFVSLIGPSGCGKSTLLRTIGDLLNPSQGEVTVAGKTAAQARADREYGMVFQSPTLFSWRTVRRNIELPLEILGMPKDARAVRADEMLALVGLSDFARHRPAQLSGGMQQRVAIARALSFEPKLLLMDEPFGALDEINRERLNAELLRIWRQVSSTVVFVTHSIPEAVFLSTRIVVMSPRPGRIVAALPVDLEPERDQDTRESERYYELVTEVRELLRRAGAT